MGARSLSICDTTNIGGPPPKPLAQYPYRIVNGELYVTDRLNNEI